MSDDDSYSTNFEKSKLTPSGQFSGSVALKVATQLSRVNFLHDMLAQLNRPEAVDLSASGLENFRMSTQDIWVKFSSVHDDITESCPLDFLSSDYIVGDVFSTAFNLRSQIALKDQLAPPSLNGSGAAAGTRHHLPKISLPSFTGAYSEWCSFWDLFTALVRENTEITDVKRMYYLRTSTTGESAKLIASLAIEADSFATAWETLLERYENKRILVAAHVEHLLNTKVIASRSAPWLHSLLHGITEATKSLKALGAPIEHWDWVLVHAVSRRLDQATREARELTAAQSTEPPSFSQFRTFLINRARALEGAGLG